MLQIPAFMRLVGSICSVIVYLSQNPNIKKGKYLSITMNDRKTELGDRDFLAPANKNKKRDFAYVIMCQMIC